MFHIFQVESTSRCNLGRCLVCPRTSVRREVGDMEWETYEKISCYFDFVDFVDLSGWGEPLLHERIYDMIKLAKEKKCFVGFTTNGTLLTESVSERLIALNLDLIAISIDGVTAGTYESVRKGAKFETLVNNIKNLTLSKQGLKSKKPKVVLAFLMMKRNISELPSLVDLASKLSVDQILVKNVAVTLKMEDDEQRLFSCNQEGLARETVENIEKAKSKARQNGITLNVSPLELRDRPVCLADPLKSVYFTWDGYVSPCDSLAHIDVPRIFCGKREKSIPLRHFGNVQKESLYKIWEKEDYRKFRQLFYKRQRLYNSFIYRTLEALVHFQAGRESFNKNLVAPLVCRSCHYLYLWE